jgi:hypothetical protein
MLDTVQRHCVRAMTNQTLMRPALRAIAVVAVALGILAVSCGRDVSAFECAAGAKLCTVAGKPTCVALDDPKFGCSNPSICVSCGTLGFEHVKIPMCDRIRGVCAVFGCDDGYQHCEGDESGGCETSINSDLHHCGRCNKPCPDSLPNGAPACILGQCTVSCSAGFFNCNLRVDDGCECTKGCMGTACMP